MATDHIDPLGCLSHALASVEGAPAIRLRRLADGWPDAVAFSRAPERTAAMLSASLGSAGVVSEVVARGGSVAVRFGDRLLGEAVERLREDPHASLRPPTAPLPRAIVAFCDPNATKALHLGHLRNLAVGDGIARLLAHGGAEVTRQSVVCDAGRAVAETVAGYLSGRVGADPDALGLLPDVFVGRCYARYHRDHPVLDAEEPDPDARRSATSAAVGTDPATRVLHALRAGEPAATAIWAQLRGWVLEGHARTFERLGVAFERLLFEADSVELVAAVAEEAVRAGVFEREPDGTIVMRGGRADVRVPMIRADGVETGYMRHFAIWLRLHGETLDPTHCVNVTGSEWRTTGLVREAALSALIPCPLYESHHRLSVGMVRADGQIMKSRHGAPLLIDECLDRMGEALAEAGLCERSDADEAASLVLKCALLARPASKPMSVCWEQLCDRRASPGWRILEARARCALDAQSGDVRGVDAREPDLRYAVLRAYELPAIWQAALDAHEPGLIVKFMTSLANWYLSDARSNVVAETVSATLAAAGASIGVIAKEALTVNAPLAPVS